MKAKLLKKIRRPSEKASGLDLPKPIVKSTVKEHRQRIIGGARKYIYKTRTRKQIVTVSVVLFVVAILVFFSVSAVMLYKFRNTSTFIYRVTQVIPFPIAKAGSSYVSYENYLFEVRHYIHYYAYRSEQPVDFDSGSGQSQLNHYKNEALQQVIDLAYAKQLAKANGVKVTESDIDAEMAIAKARLGRNNQEFAQVLQSFWGWSISDYKRELGNELLLQKVAQKLDTASQSKAQEALKALNSGEDFATVVKMYSEDSSTSQSGGVYPELINQNTTDVAPQVVAEVLKLKIGEVSPVVYTGSSLEILKLISNEQGGLKVAHIQINIKPISFFIEPLEAKNPPVYYISLPKD